MNAPVLSCGQETVGTLQFTDIDCKPRQAVVWIRVENIPGARLQVRSLLLPSRLPQQSGVIDQAAGQIRMIGGERFLLNGDGAPVERFGFFESPLFRAGRSQVVQYQRYIWVIRTQPVLCDPKCSRGKLLRFGISLQTTQKS